MKGVNRRKGGRSARRFGKACTERLGAKAMKDLAMSKMVLPYSRIVGQQQLKLALELAYVSPAVGGVLLTGERGTGKSTVVRAFSQMLFRGNSSPVDGLPVTLPINATEDRVVGGWDIDSLFRPKAGKGRKGPRWRRGLLEAAHGKMLYVDEINLLDDHIVNIILDVTATGFLIVARDGSPQGEYRRRVSSTLVGTMNPEEGLLRPQLLDRFGLMVPVSSLKLAKERIQVLENVLRFDQAVAELSGGAASNAWLKKALAENGKCRKSLLTARSRLSSVGIPSTVKHLAVTIAEKFGTEGHRADVTMMLAAQALAAREGRKRASRSDVQEIAPLAIAHRRPNVYQDDWEPWSKKDDAKLSKIVS